MAWWKIFILFLQCNVAATNVGEVSEQPVVRVMIDRERICESFFLHWLSLFRPLGGEASVVLSVLLIGDEAGLRRYRRAFGRGVRKYIGRDERANPISRLRLVVGGADCVVGVAASGRECLGQGACIEALAARRGRRCSGLLYLLRVLVRLAAVADLVVVLRSLLVLDGMSHNALSILALSTKGWVGA
jgi:hypothetical protein